MKLFGYMTVHIHLKSGTVLKVKCSHWEFTSKGNEYTKYRFNGLVHQVGIKDPSNIVAYRIVNPWWAQAIRAITVRLENDNKLD